MSNDRIRANQRKPHVKKARNERLMRRYHGRRAAALEQLGGVCVRCGTDERLHFDHIDPATKSFALIKGFTHKSDADVQAELEKCQLLCHGCHSSKTRKEEVARLGTQARWAT